MKRISKTYRLSAETLEKIDELRKENPEKEYTATDVIEIAIRRTKNEKGNLEKF